MCAYACFRFLDWLFTVPLPLMDATTTPRRPPHDIAYFIIFYYYNRGGLPISLYIYIYIYIYIYSGWALY